MHRLFQVSTILLCTLILFSSCATLLTGSTQNITFDSEPSGAKLYIDGMQEGTTPATVKVKKGRSHDIMLSKEGYREYPTVLSARKTHWTVFLNYLAIVNVGWFIDAYVGSAEIFTQTSVSGNLIKNPAKVVSSEPVYCKEVQMDLLKNEVGQKLKKGKPKGVIFKENLPLNTGNYDQLVVKELKSVGFSSDSLNATVSIQPTIKSIDYKLDAQRGGNYYSSCTIFVEWTLYLKGKEVFKTITTGEGKRPTQGSYAIELAFQSALYRFMLNEALYINANAKTK